MKKLLLIIAVISFVSVSYAQVRFTGKDMICQNIGFLSTECKDANIVPMEYYDREIAIEKAKQPTETTIDKSTMTIINNLIKEAEKQSEEDDEIIIKTYFEEEGN
jgi:hypothetical protein